MSLFDSMPKEANQLSPKSITVSRIIISIFSLLLVGITIFIAIVNSSWIKFSFGIGVAMIVFILGFIWAKKRYDYSFWWFTQEGLYIQKGVIWRARIFVPYNRVQHTDVAQGPLERKYSLGQLIIHTAGTKDSSVTLKGLEFELANELRNKLIDDEKADAV